MKRRRIPRSRAVGRVSSAVTAAAAASAAAAAAATAAAAGTGTGTGTGAGAMGMARKCCVRSCEADVREARAKGLPLHKFPKDVALRDRWLASGGFDESFKPTPGQVVCHRHFKRADYDHAARGGHKFLLKRGSVPTVFADYDNHPDPVIMSVKSSTSYAQEDLDLINSEILNLEHSTSPLSEARTPKSDSCGETCYSRPESSMDSLNLPDGSEVTDNECKMANLKEEIVTLVKDKLVENSDSKVNTVAMQLGIVEGATMKADGKDLIIKEELKNIKLSDDKEFDKSEELKPKVLNRDGTKFYPGAKLEAKDFNEKWYSAKVVETDWDEREVLIHFDKWSSRFDEWIPMDSSRLRVLQTPPHEQTWILPSPEAKVREFSVGERVLATWADGRKYPAKVNTVLTNDRYDVLFDDGYAKIVKSSKMTKIAESSAKQLSELEGYIGSKQERRDKKRKHTVMELFNTHSRRRTKNDADKASKKEETVVKESGESSIENKVEMDGTLFGACYDPGTDLLRGFETNPSKIKSYSKKSKKEMPKNDTDHEEDPVGPEWIDGEPQGTESYIVDGNDGPRRSIIVPDRRLPPGWEKHFTQRKAGTSAGKWDVLFIHKQTGKKFRSRNDIRVFMENQGQYDFNPENFDFCIHRRKRNHASRLKQEATPEKKIKTLLPKTKTLPTSENPLLQVTNNTAASPNLSTPVTPATDGAVFIGLRGGLRVEMEDNAYKCPKEGCNKNFRKENLLQMHIKHYHPEYSKFLGSTPKVEDLAYARTIGESIDDIIPKKSTTFLDKINKFAKKKSLPEKSSTLLQSTLNTMQPTSPSIPHAASVLPELEEEIDQVEKCNDSQKEDMKIETMSSISNHSMEIDDDIEKKRENTCALSPGTLFDMKVKEEKPQGGIKTLLPVRPSTTSEVQKVDRVKSLDENTHVERTKGQKKRQISEHSVDLLTKGKKRHVMSDLNDSFGDLDDSAMDAEGPAALMYRYSRRKSDSKSDENSQNSQLNDSRIEKGDPLKGDIIKTDINNDTEESEGVMMMINGEMVKVEQLRREEIINCTCGFMEEDGLMIQCDLCLCWQHGHCNAIEREKDVPEKYICYICQHPYRQRPSKKYFHDQDWIKEGKLPSLSNRTRNQHTINQRTAMLKRSYDLVAALLQIQQLLHSLRVKINVAQKKDHPKLYLWAKNWEKMEIPKIDIEPVPIMEIVKTGPSFTDVGLEIPRRAETKTDVKLPIKDDQDEKSIASDSELMKILEEDSTHSDESKIINKKENFVTSKDSHILLDALTSGNSDIKERNVAMSDIKTENAGNKIMSENSTSESLSLNSGPLIDNIQQESSIADVENEVSALPQPFIPEPEAPIDPTECRMRLLEHIEHFQCHLDSRLTSIEAQICALEAMDPDELTLDPHVQPRTKQTVQMLLRDLSTVRKLAALC